MAAGAVVPTLQGIAIAVLSAVCISGFGYFFHLEARVAVLEAKVDEVLRVVQYAPWAPKPARYPEK